MSKKIINNIKGVTLVALVVTIIVLLILAGVAINLTIGSNGLFSRTQNAVNKYKEAEENEVKMLNEILGEIYDTKEIDKPIIEVVDKDTWTKDGKTVKISKEEKSITKYTTDGSNPSAENGKIYEGEFIVEENCIIKAVYVTNTKRVSEMQIEKIDKIDKLPPIQPVIELSAGKINVDVTIKSEPEDSEANETSGKSGISQYRLSRDGGANWVECNADEKEYKFNNIFGDLTGVKCDVIVELVDNAGNTSRATETVTTKCLNTTYYKTGAINLGNYNNATSRTFTKKYSDGAICVWMQFPDGGQNWNYPILISNTKNGAYYHVSGDMNQDSPVGPITWNRSNILCG